MFFWGWDIQDVVHFMFGLFVVEVAVVLVLGPRMIGEICRRRGVLMPPRFARVAACFGAGLAGIVIWMAVFVGAVIFGAFTFDWLKPFHPKSADAAMIVCILVGIVVGSFLAWYYASRITIGTFLREGQTLSWRERLGGPGALVLLCIWVFWAFMPGMMATFRNRAMDGVYLANLHGIGRAMLAYQENYGVYPEHLGQLVDEGLIGAKWFWIPRSYDWDDPEDGQPCPAPTTLLYMRLSANAPGDIAWVWRRPEFHKTAWTQVLYHDGTTKQFRVGELPAELRRSNERLATWLAEEKRKD